MTELSIFNEGQLREEPAQAVTAQGKPRPIRAGDKVTVDTATQDHGKVRLGDWHR